MLEIVRSNRLEALLESLGETLGREPLRDPMQSESIVVPSRGMERWVSQRLAEHLGAIATPSAVEFLGPSGICANVEFPFPTKVARMALDCVDDHPMVAAVSLSGGAGLGGRASATLAPADLWDRDALTWLALKCIDQGLEEGQAAFEGLANYLGYPRSQAQTPGAAASPFALGVGRRAYALARRVATVFDRYAQHRPDIVAKLRAASSLKADAEPALRWQAALWQSLEAHIDADPFCVRQQRASAALRAPNSAAKHIAPRLSFFGFASMPPALLATFDALSTHFACRIYVLTPTQGFWGDTRQRKRLLRDPTQSLDPASLSAGEGHPLLASSGRVAREFQSILESQLEGYREASDCFVDPTQIEGQGPTGALRLLQSDLLYLRNRELDQPDAPIHTLDARDDSIRVHSCYGKARQVECLREAILAAMDADPSLNCRDFLVMSPDIETYAPLIESVFSRGQYLPAQAPASANAPTHWQGATGTPRLRIKIADRLRHTRDPVVRATLDLLALVGARRSLVEVIDLLSHALIREQFAIDAAQVEQLLGWAASAGARWGSDGQHRARFGQPEHSRHTWRAALDRMALGVAMADEGGLWQSTSPFDPIEGQGVDLFGKFATFCERLFTTLDELIEPRPLHAWADDLAEAAAKLLALDTLDPADDWRNQRLGAALESLRSLGRVVHDDEHLSEEADQALTVELEVVTQMIVDSVDGGGHAIGQQGAITFCAMAPMRSIPHRVVALLGMDHGVFPRPHTPDGFDLMTTQARVGDPLVRDAERFLFIEALLAARDQLIITYEGRDISRGEVTPPANAVRELLEHLEHAFRAPDSDRASARSHFLREEHLHAHDLRYFTLAAAHFDRAHLHAAQAGLRRTLLEQAALEQSADAPVDPASNARDPAQLPALDPPDELDLERLIRALQHPAKAHAQERLGVYLPRDEQDKPTRESLELDGLESYALDAELLAFDAQAEGIVFANEGTDPAEERDALEARALLPPGSPGAYAMARGVEKRESIAELIDAVKAERPDEVLQARDTTLRVQLEGLTLHGRVRVHGQQTRLIAHRSSTLSAKRELRAWVEHLAWQASQAQSVSSYQLLAGKAKPVALPQLTQAQAKRELGRWVEAYLTNRNKPLAFFPESSRAYTKGLRPKKKGKPASLSAQELAEQSLAKAAATYASDGKHSGVPGEGYDPYNRLIWGDTAQLPAIARTQPFREQAEALWAEFVEPGAGEHLDPAPGQSVNAPANHANKCATPSKRGGGS